METTKIDSLLQRHEVLKLKGLQLGEQDLFDRVALWEEMADSITELRSQYQEQKQANEVEKGKRMIELKAELDENGKKKYTESTAEAVIRQEFYQQDLDLSVLKTKIELLQNRTTVIGEYVNIVKMHLKKDFIM
ncbi:hypothetical protein BSK20_03680 [SR1 bacterium human oral taxon HOT-345]|nr:hypothetical protein BSK20_03680 [SR1 bacterium human oral taxon HOT-345]